MKWLHTIQWFVRNTYVGLMGMLLLSKNIFKVETIEGKVKMPGQVF